MNDSRGRPIKLEVRVRPSDRLEREYGGKHGNWVCDIYNGRGDWMQTDGDDGHMDREAAQLRARAIREQHRRKP